MQWSSLHRLGLLLLLCALLPAARSEEPLPWSQLLACQGVHRQYPFCDTSLPLEDRVKDVIARLELSEKLEMLTARRSPLGAVRRLGIPEFNYGTNCVHAVKSRCTSTKCPTLFPAPPNLAATFNDSIWELVGEVMAVELRVLWRLGVGENNENNLPHMGLTCWGPTINMAKDPRWGRNMCVLWKYTVARFLLLLGIIDEFSLRVCDMCGVCLAQGGSWRGSLPCRRVRRQDDSRHARRRPEIPASGHNAETF